MKRLCILDRPIGVAQWSGFFLCGLWLAGCGPHHVPKAPEVSQFSSVVESSATILATGDIMMHGAVKKSAQTSIEISSEPYTGFRSLFDDIGWELGAADIAFANLETPVAPASDHGSRAFVFNAPPDLLKALNVLGLDVVSFANNHVYDQGRDGFEETLHQLESAHLSYVGSGFTREAARTPLIFRCHGIRIAFIGASDVFNTNLNIEESSAPFANPLDVSSMTASIQRARSLADFVIVSIHWGEEYHDKPTERQVTIAHALLEAGADVILGHHPHVLEPLEPYKTKDGRNTFVIYSLGNFISNQSRNYISGTTPDDVGEARDGILLSLTVVKKDYGPAGTRVELGPVHYSPVWTENDTLTAKGTPKIRVVSIDRTRERIKRSLEELAGKKKTNGELSSSDASEFVALTKELDGFNKRRAIILDRVGEDFATPLTPLQPLPRQKPPEIISATPQP